MIFRSPPPPDKDPPLAENWDKFACFSAGWAFYNSRGGEKNAVWDKSGSLLVAHQRLTQLRKPAFIGLDFLKGFALFLVIQRPQPVGIIPDTGAALLIDSLDKWVDG